MKPVQILLLVAAGALGGAIITTQVWHKPQQPKKMAVAEAPQPAAPPATAPVEPAPAAAPAPAPAQELPMPEAQQAADKPSPVAPALRREVARPRPVSRPVTRTAPPPANPRPVQTARVEDPEPRPHTEYAPAPPAQVAAPAPERTPPPPARAEPEHETPAVPPPPPPNRVTLNTGFLLPVRLIDGLSTERNLAGDTFTGTLDKELVVDGFVIAERGARVEGRVTNVDRGGKTRGVAEMAIELTRIHTSDGQAVAIQTDAFDRRAEASHQADAEKIGVGAAAGAIIGAIAGGGKGAAIGAGVGGGAGAGDVLLTRGKPVTFASETRVSFRLRAPVTITERR